MAKGEEGKMTGGKARKSIREQEKKGSTQEDIARATRRDPSTISAIKSGEIKNPPKELIANIKKAKTSKKKKK